VNQPHFEQIVGELLHAKKVLSEAKTHHHEICQRLVEACDLAFEESQQNDVDAETFVEEMKELINNSALSGTCEGNCLTAYSICLSQNNPPQQCADEKKLCLSRCDEQ
jgi:hypothetical protein